MTVTVIGVLNAVVNGLYMALLARVALSWLPHDRHHPLVEGLYRVTDPLLKPFQDIVPADRLGGLDLSPLFACLALKLSRDLLIFFFFG